VNDWIKHKIAIAKIIDPHLVSLLIYYQYKTEDKWIECIKNSWETHGYSWDIHEKFMRNLW
jgi:hypothetical protein